MAVKTIAFVRKLDELGRVVIPREITRENGWGHGTMLECVATEEGVIFKPFRLAKQCYICRNQEDLVNVFGHCLCKGCVNEANKKKPVE